MSVWFRMLFRLALVLITTVWFSVLEGLSQNLQVGLPVVEEWLRINQLDGKTNPSISFLQRPLDISKYRGNWNKLLGKVSLGYLMNKDSLDYTHPKIFFVPLPLYLNMGYNTGIPYPTTSNLLMNKGLQTYFSGGAFLSLGPLSIQVQPEFIYAQNKDFNPGSSKSSNTEYMERFGESSYLRFFPGQSSIRLNFGAFSFGVSTENIWWGPGQFNSLLFSNNAFGFPHLTLNTRRPAKTFLGTFEGQLIMGKLQGSGLPNTNIDNLVDDWRYLNGISFSYQPKWINGVFFGISRVFQQYDSYMGNTFSDYFPIFDAFQKKDQFENGNDSGTFDAEGRDQQVTFFGRYVIPKAKAEIYFEYGRRDHAYDWREAILNPEHARAFLVGFSKLILLENQNQLLIKSELTHQQESINIIVRYPGIGGSLNWSGHGVVRHGFTNYGQMMGPGIGPSSNSQTLEVSWLKNINKIGMKFERLNRHQDFYTAYLNDPSEPGRWVDYNLGLLGNFKFSNFVVSSELNAIYSHNYLWDQTPFSSLDFPDGKKYFTFQGQIALIAFLNR